MKGDVVAFVSDRDGNPEIYIMGTDGSSPRNISNNPAQDLEPTFKPAGGWIAFSTDRDGNLEIYVMDENGGNLFNMTANSGQDRHPVWQ